MNDMRPAEALEDAGPQAAIVFTGRWREFLPIALTNLLLIIVTLGIYRFWAKARERRYLWSRTYVIDDHLDWTGTGREMFVGFLIVTAVVLPVLLTINVLLPALFLRGYWGWGIAVVLVLYGGIFYLYHVARFRALRYQLSRSWWHGIRGGGAEGGWSYGFEAVWRYAAGASAAGLLIPWAMAAMWNRRWRSMSFGPDGFATSLDFSVLMWRWVLRYLVPFAGVFFIILFAAFGAGVGALAGEAGAQFGAVAAMILALVAVYLLYLVISISYYALFYRTAAAALSLGGLRFEFDARTKDWLKLYLGNIAIVVFTLGLGLVFLSYRNWSFRVRHTGASGTVDLSLLTQSTTRSPAESEGLADAFDVGSI
jgi:uncharacterized membrane protein YjgN (DUF898 family)